MRARRAVALGVVAWVVVAVAGVTVVWGVISRAGQGVSGQLDAAPAADGAAAGTATGPPTGRRTVSSDPSPSPSDPAPRPTSGSPSATVTAPPDTGGTSAPSDPGTGAEPAAVTRTWQGQAGYVSATCQGPVIAIAGAAAYSGYRIERDDDGPDRVRVEFENDDTDLRVEAECVDGTPVFATD